MDEKSLDVLRSEIDQIDDAILRLFLKRMDTVAAVADYKARHAVPVLDTGREERILARVEQNAGDTYAKDARELFCLLFQLSRNAQNRRL